MKLIKIHVVEDVQKYYTLCTDKPYSAAMIIQSALENGITNIKIDEAQKEDIDKWNKRKNLETPTLKDMLGGN